MTEKSLFWYTDGFNGDTGDGAAPYTQEEFRLFNHAWMAKNQDNAGVFRGVLNEMAVSGSSSPLTVSTGRASVYGFPYWTDAAVSVAATTPSVGDTGKRVVLRADWTAQTVRVVLISSSDGVATLPSLTQTAGTTWDIPLASFVIDTSGNIWTDSGKSVAGVTDEREWALLGKENQTVSFIVNCVGVENVTDGTFYDELEYGSAVMKDSKLTTGSARFLVPSDYYSDLSVKSLVIPKATGDINGQTGINVTQIGGAFNAGSSTNSGAVAVTINENEAILEVTASANAGDVVRCFFQRIASDPADTINADVVLVGWVVSYTAAFT